MAIYISDNEGNRKKIAGSGKTATINGVEALNISASNGLSGTMSGSTYTISGENLLPKEKVLVFGPQTVQTSAWSADSSYKGYGFRAAVALSGVTADYFAYVAFGAVDAVGGKLAPFCDTYAGGVYIYAAEQPGEAVNIGSVLCSKG